MWGTAGVSDAHDLDQQAAMEWAISLLTAGLDGANLIHDVGYLGQGLVGHPAAIVMCAEIISYVKRLLKGFRIDPERLDLDVFRQVGPKEHFLTTDQTLKFFRSEHWQPRLLNRKTLEQWQDGTPDTWRDRAIVKTKEILIRHRPTPIEDRASADIAKLRSDAAEELSQIDFAT
jgi:trimethylamine--corrinoid protein Co-methyltransferase